MDTIFALATAQGRAGVAIIRVSGPDAGRSCVTLAGSLPASRALRAIRGQDGVLLDEALVLSFEAGKSFTGEAVVEFHLHGSPTIVRAVLRALSEIPGLRQAEPGEFTRRAMENGRLSLAEVEGLADLIDAETEAQRRQALRVFSGALGDLAADWRSKLVRAAALLEATIDFVDEDVPVDVVPEVRSLLEAVIPKMKTEAAGVGIAERIRDGFEVAIVGPPNVGKSTLLNRLAGRDVAITSEVAGTTRDVIEVRMDLNGLPVTMLDTAGQRETEDVVEAIGVERASVRAARADLRVHLGGLEPDEVGPDDIWVAAKVDEEPTEGLGVSGKTGDGVDELITVISGRLQQKASNVGTAMRERHRSAIIAALGYLETVEHALADDAMLPDLIAEDLRAAIGAVDSIIGRVDVEHVLDEIFASFCIGK